MTAMERTVPKENWVLVEVLEFPAASAYLLTNLTRKR